MCERERLAIAILPILGEPSAAIEPSERALDNPAFRQQNEPFLFLIARDDFEGEAKLLFHPVNQAVFGIHAVRDHLL